jgi:O-antigen ligase
LRNAALLALPFLVFTLLLTRSRSAIALLCAVFLSRELWATARPLGGWFRGGRALVSIALLGGLVAALIERIDLPELWAVGWGGRIAIWRASLEMIRDNWALGVGLGRFADYFSRYQLIRYYTRYPHNFLLEVFAELGVVGVLALLGFLGASFGGLIARLRRPLSGMDERNVLITLLSAGGFLVAHAAVDIDWHAPGNVVLLFTLLGIARARWCSARGDVRGDHGERGL